MNTNPISDFFDFMTDSTVWLTPVFWLLLIASAGIAFTVWSRFPEQRHATKLLQWLLRLVMGGFWWQQSLWKLPPLYTQHPEAPLTTGLAYWMIQMGKYAAVPLQSDVVNNIVLPHFYWFAPFVFAQEILTAVSLMLGVFTRLFAVIGALQILNLWLGLYNAPGEWPWTYFFLLVVQIMLAVHCYGRSLGVDALLAARPANGRKPGMIGRLVAAAI